MEESRFSYGKKGGASRIPPRRVPGRPGARAAAGKRFCQAHAGVGICRRWDVQPNGPGDSPRDGAHAPGGMFVLCLREIRRAGRILDAAVTGCVLKRVAQADALSLLLTCVDRGKTRTGILLSCDPEYARVCALEDTGAPGAPAGSFAEFARARLAGAIVSGVSVSGRNRQIRLELDARPDSWSLILSIMGPRSNLYLADAMGRLAHAMRPLEETRRDLKIGDVWTDPAGSAPSEGVDRWEDVADDAYLGAIGRQYGQMQLRRDALGLARTIEQVLGRERQLLGRKWNRLEEDLAQARLAETYRRKGELLKTVLHEIRPGDDRITASDYAAGAEVDIALDPDLSPSENLEAYFERYRKDSRGAGFIEQQLSKLTAERREIDAAESSVRAAMEADPPDRPALERIGSTPLVRRLIGRYAPRRPKAAVPERPKAESAVPARLRPKRYRTGDGLEIWVGRSDEGNDYVTTRMARGNDLFFHLEGYPGSHVILRTGGRTDPPPASVLDACELAVHFSKMKEARSADVHVAPVKNVKKPAGAKPGLVYVSRGRTIRLRRDPARLQNILASRIDA